MVSAEAHHPAFQCPVYDVFPFMQNRQAVISPSESHKGFPPCLPCCLKKIPFSDELTDRYPVPYAGLSHFHLVIVDTKLHLCRKQDAPEGYTFPRVSDEPMLLTFCSLLSKMKAAQNCPFRHTCRNQKVRLRKFISYCCVLYPFPLIQYSFLTLLLTKLCYPSTILNDRLPHL